MRPPRSRSVRVGALATLAAGAVLGGTLGMASASGAFYADQTTTS